MRTSIKGCFRLSAIVLPAIVLAAGCSRSGAPPVAPVTGVITLDGKPLADVGIAFEPDEGSFASTAWTDENGRYELKFTSDMKGAVIGTHTVFIFHDEEAETEEGEEIPETLPAQYNSESTLTREVKRGKNVFNFDLTSDEQPATPE